MNPPSLVINWRFYVTETSMQWNFTFYFIFECSNQGREEVFVRRSQKVQPPDRPVLRQTQLVYWFWIWILGHKPYLQSVPKSFKSIKKSLISMRFELGIFWTMSWSLQYVAQLNSRLDWKFFGLVQMVDHLVFYKYPLLSLLWPVFEHNLYSIPNQAQ